MTSSKASSRAPFYDLFKLIAAIILLLIFLFLFVWMQPAQARQPELISATLTPLPHNTQTLPPTLAVAPASETPPPPTQPPSPTAIPASSTPLPPTQPPSPTATSVETPTPTPPPFTETPVLTEEPLPTPIVEIPAETNVCEAVSRSQLQVGMQAIIQRRVNFRSSPGIKYNWLLTLIPGTRVEVIGGPACTRYEGGGAYLWWQIRLPNGMEGWSAETSAYGTFYFMEPVP